MLKTSVLLQNNNNNKTTTVIAKAALGHSMRLQSQQKSVLKTAIVVKIKNETAQHFNYELENLAIGLFYPTTLALIFQLKLPYLPFGELKKNA